MAGSKRERRPGVWELRIPLGSHPDTRERLTHSEIYRGGTRAAERRLAALVAQRDELRDQRIHPTDDTMTVADLARHWVSIHQGDWSPTTLADHQRTITNYISPGLGRHQVITLTKARISRWYADLHTHGGQNRTPLSAQTVRKIHSVLHAILEDAIDLDLIAVNPATKAKRPKAAKYTATVPTITQITAAIATADPLMAVLIRVAIATGARRGELVALRWDDIALTPGIETIHILRSAVKLPHQPVTTKSTKTGATAVIGIGPATADVLRLWRIQQDSDPHTNGTPWLFPDPLHPTRPINPDTVTYRWTRIADGTGMPSVRLHDLRHATATHLISGGTDVRTVAGRLRHASPAMTLDVYAARDLDADRSAGQLIDQLLAQ